jgi:threonyl-tRNA synthetase
MWLSPEQVRVLPISERLLDKAQEVTKELKLAGLRVTCDTRSEKIGYKIREAQMEKVNYMLIIGDKEAEAGTVSVRKRGEIGDIGSMPLADFIAMAKEEIDTKKIG